MKRILSGITPSGDGSLHIGNYLGAVKQFIELSQTHECFLMFADLHALTTIQHRKTLQQNTETLILNEIALVGELPNVYFFRQSDIPLHTELQTILSNVTPLGLVKRAHAYKDKLAKDVLEEDINLGLFNYPILMAADILLYKADVVPVGKDQKQHIEIARDIAERFNKNSNKAVFTLPEPYIPEHVAVVMGTDGQRKMSKSLGNLISIFESDEVIRKQVNSTFTDPTRVHATDPGHIEGNMVFTYLDHFGDSTQVASLKEQYQQGKVGDAEVKDVLYQSLLSYFKEARLRYQTLKESPKKVQEILEIGTARTSQVAANTMKEVREAIGLTNQYSFFAYQTHRTDGIISIDDFAKVQLRVGKVVEATHPEKSEKLIRLEVDFGPIGEIGVIGEVREIEGQKHEVRVVFTAVRPFGYTKDDFQGKQFFFVYNLLPRKMMNEESQGMILAVDSPRGEAGDAASGKPIFVSAEGMPVGATVR